MKTPVKHQEQILEAIDQLRHRKARPDAERIYNCLFRRYSISCPEAKIALEKCVEAGVVLRVAYKGNISYRNAAKKFSHLKRDSQGEIIRSQPGKPRRKFTALLTSAYGELVMQEPDYLALGVPPHELIRTILAKDSVRYTKRYVSILLDKEVESGDLIRMENGDLLVGPTKTDSCQLDSPPPINEHNNLTETPQEPTKFKKKTGPKQGFRKEKYMEALRNDDRRNESLRVGGRRKVKTCGTMGLANLSFAIAGNTFKRAKKVFDPSDNNIPKKRGRPIGSLNKSTIERQKLSDSDSRPESRASLNGREQGGVCSVCHLQNKKGPNERMVSCRECSNKAHASCLNGDEDMMLKMYPDNTWQCPHCKTCVVCFETSDAGYLVVCSICADAYHMGCHQPKIMEKVKSGTKWLCINCQMPEQLAVDHIQIGYNMDAVKMNTNNDDTRSPTPDLSRNSSPTNYMSLPPSPTPPTLSPQTSTHNVQHTSPNEDQSDSDSKSEPEIHSFKEEEVEENIDPKIPDASNWSSDDVYRYFFQYFPHEASVFKEQEIDGHSLLLMRRMDVLKGLALKLGPALKIYRHILKLQYRRDDRKLYWV